jgi:sulfate adenylyltransferase
MNKGFDPLTGFMDEDNYLSVIHSMRLTSGTVWPMPIVLDVQDAAPYHVGEDILLCDEYGKPVALLTITSIYEPDKKMEAKLVYNSLDEDHYGVNYLFNRTGKFYLGGNVKQVAEIDRYDFLDLRYKPYELKKIFKQKKWNQIIGFQTRNPLHRAHYSMIRLAAEEYKANVLLHPSVGMTKDGDIDYITRTKCYMHLYRNYINDFAFLSLLPLAMRMAGPREALWHAIIRRNYGCTHFIVGRDHSGPGKDKQGKPFYQPYEAQDLVSRFAKEIGITPIFFQEMVYVEEKKSYFPINKVKKGDTIKRISGTEFRRRMFNDEPIPEWFSFPEIIEEIKRSTKRLKKDGLVIFFTGLPSSGKSTLARHLYFKLLTTQDKNITLLDGDVIRQSLSKGLGFSKEDRDENIMRIGFVANEIARHKGIVICAAIAPYEEARLKNRLLISSDGQYVEIYVSTPQKVCVQRDVKGLYKLAKKGKLKQVSGLDDVYEPPRRPEIVIDTSTKSPEECTSVILDYLIENKLILPSL